jgi:hypothetical protein
LLLELVGSGRWEGSEVEKVFSHKRPVVAYAVSCMLDCMRETATYLASRRGRRRSGWMGQLLVLMLFAFSLLGGASGRTLFEAGHGSNRPTQLPTCIPILEAMKGEAVAHLRDLIQVRGSHGPVCSTHGTLLN